MSKKKKKVALSPREKIAKGSIGLMRTEPFYSNLLMQLDLIETTTVPTFGTDGESIFYNPSFAGGLTAGNVRVVLLHEVEHVALGHHIRLAEMVLRNFGPGAVVEEGETRLEAVWNIACDLAVNEHLKNDPDLPKIGMCIAGRDRFAAYPSARNAEVYYSLLKEEAEKEREDERKRDSSDRAEPGDRGGSSSGDARREPGSDRDGEGDSRDDRGGPLPNEDREESSDRAADSFHPDGRDDPSDRRGDEGTHSGEDSGTSHSPSPVGDVDDDSRRSEPDEGPAPDGSRPGNARGDREGAGGGSDRLRDLREGAVDRLLPAKVKSEEELAGKRQEWERKVVSAYVATKQAGGTVPGWASELVERIEGVAQVPWRTELRRICTTLVETDFSFIRPDRRSAYRRDVILPCPYTEGLGNAMLAVDTSGSMGQKEMNLLFPELETLIRTYPTTKFSIFQFDTRVLGESVKTFDVSNLPMNCEEWEWIGRGGTDFLPLFEYVREQRERPDVLIVLTDGEPNGDVWPETLPCPVVWLITTDIIAPIGRTIHMEVDG